MLAPPSPAPPPAAAPTSLTDLRRPVEAEMQAFRRYFRGAMRSRVGDSGFDDAVPPRTVRNSIRFS